MIFLRWFMGFEYKRPLVLRAISVLRQKLCIYIRLQKLLEKPGEERPTRFLAESAEYSLIAARSLYFVWIAFQSLMRNLPMIRICKRWFDLVFRRGLKCVS